MAGGIKLSALMTEIKVDVQRFKSDMSKAASIGVSEADRISKQLSTTAKVGETLSRTGTALTMGLTLPIVGVGTAVTKMAIDFESNFAKVSTLLDSNAVDILTTAINGYGMKTEDATKISDMLITTQNLGKTTVDELSTSMGAVIPVANSVNFGIEELSTSYAQLTKNGIKTSEAGTYLKSMLSELGKSGSVADKALRELSGKGFAQLKEEGVPTSEILKQLGDYAEKNGKTLKDMFGSVEAGSAALVLGKEGGAEYNEILTAMGNSAGATQEAFEKIDSTPAEQLKGALNELKNEGIKFGAAFVPVIEKTAGILGKVSDAFSSLSEEQQENVIKWGMVLAATGPVLKVVGGGISTFTKLSSVIGGAGKALGVVKGAGFVGNLVGLLGVCAPVVAGVAAVGAGIYAVHESSQLAKRGVNEAKEEMSLMERVIATLTGTEVRSRKELEEMGYVHKQFSKDISPEFQKAVEESTKKVQDFNVFLREISFDGVIDKGESDKFNQQIDDVCEEVIKTIQSKKDKSQESLKKLFIADDQVIDEGEQKVLEILSRSSDLQIEEVGGLKAEILRIKQVAVDEGRALNEQEIKDIETHNARLRQIELEAVGGTQAEIAYAKNEFNARIKTMDLDAAAKLMKEKAKVRDEEVIKVKASYDTEIEMLKASLSGKSAEEQRVIKEQITNLEQDRADKIGIQQSLYESYLGIIEENNPKLLEGINKFNGEVLTNADKTSQADLEGLTKRYKGLKSITETGCYELYDTIEGTHVKTAVKVDEKTKEIVGFYSNMYGVTGGYTEGMAKDAEEMAGKQDASYKKIISAAGHYVDYTKNSVVDANGKAVVSLDEVKKATKGAQEKIVEINGTKYEIKVNKKGTIESLTEISGAADSAARERTINIKSIFSGSPSQMAQRQGRGASSPKFNGLDNVPYDGYRATLHKGERVMTAQENKAYTEAAFKGSGAKDITVVVEIAGKEIKREIIPMVDYEMGKRLARSR